MPVYRGVQGKILAESIRDAFNFLSRLDIGDSARRHLNGWQAGGKLNKIMNARRDAQLAQEMLRADPGGFLSPYADILRFHALNDPPGPGGAPSEAFRIYKDMMAWGAFTPHARVVTGAAYEKEISAYLTSSYVTALGNEDTSRHSVVFRRMLKSLIDLRSMHDSNVTQWLMDNVGLIVELNRLQAKQAVEDILAMNPRAAELVPHVLYDMTDLPAREAALQLPCPIKKYIVAMPELPDHKENLQKIVADLVLRVCTIMDPVVNAGDMSTIILAGMIPGSQEIGLFIYTTEAGAQICANGMPDRVILGEDGKRVMPQPPSPRQNLRGPAPGL